MASQLHLSVSPHIHTTRTTAGIMRDVIIALLPAAIAGCVIFGLRSLAVMGVAIVAAVLSEAVFNLIVKKKQTVGDLSAVVTGLLLALNLPAHTPLWQAAVGSVFAIVIVKCVFGGLGCNLVNPAITARVFMLVAFSSMTASSYPVIEVDTSSSATPLTEFVSENGFSGTLTDLFLGRHGGAIGETCALALIIGGVYLICRKVITWHIPVAFIGTVFVCSLFYTGFDFTGALEWTLAGGLIIAAFFMATDYVTSPDTPAGKIIFGVGAGLLTVLIRFFGTYPEGASFAVLIMNILSPYIESWTARKVFGGGKA